MTKADLIRVASEASGITKKAASIALEAVLDCITSELSKGNTVTLTGFGSFRVSERAARKGINPRNGSKISIPAMTLPAFKAGKALKEAVR